MLVDTSFDESQLGEIEAMWDRRTHGENLPDREEDEGYIATIAQPFFEAVAKQMLRTDRVFTIEHGPHNRPPAEPGPQHAGLDAMAEHDAQAEWDNGCVRTATIRHQFVVSCTCSVVA